VVVPSCEFPSNLFPWLALRDLGVRVDVVDLAELADAVTSGDAPRVVAVSWIQYDTGQRVDLAELAVVAHRRGALFVADIVQGLGLLPCSLAEWDVDVAVAGGHKWLLGPEGTGLAYLAPGVEDRIRATTPGWASVVSHADYRDYELVLLDGARRYETGTNSTGLIAGLGASLDLLLGAGIDNVWRHVDVLCQHLVDGLPTSATLLSDRGPSARSGIVTFALDGTDPTAVAAELNAQGFVVRPRGGGIRVAPHGYSSVDEIDALLAALPH
jgi:selenocysteine lyase/cysteine desulfurase